METGVLQDHNGSVEENSGEFAAVSTCHVDQDGLSDVSFVHGFIQIMFSARLFDKIFSLFNVLRDQTASQTFLIFRVIKPDVMGSMSISHAERSVLFISVYDVFGRLLLMIYIIVFTIILIKGPRN